MAKKYSGHATAKQKEHLIEFMNNDDELRKGRFTNSFTRKKLNIRWENIANELNAIPGANKTAEQWKRTWKDMKIGAKRKNTMIKTYRNGTGGGPPPINDLDEVEKVVIKILEPTLLEGDTEIQESACNIHFEEDLNSFTIQNDLTNNYTVDTNEASTCAKVDKPTINTSNEQVTHQGTKPRRQVFSRKKRLEQHQRSTDRLVVLTERKLKTKEEYYTKKLEILKDNGEKLQRIADFLSQLNSTIAELI